MLQHLGLAGCKLPPEALRSVCATRSHAPTPSLTTLCRSSLNPLSRPQSSVKATCLAQAFRLHPESHIPRSCHLCDVDILSHRALLDGLALNTQIRDLHLDLSACEVGTWSRLWARSTSTHREWDLETFPTQA